VKIIILYAFILSILFPVSFSVLADEPCNITLCLWGKVSGSGNEGCQGQIKKFFNKQVKKKGNFLPDHTADARKALLQSECPSDMAPAQYINDIISRFGRIRG
jgi:hypothetical protein